MHINNKLIKLRDKFLKRSKSTVGICQIDAEELKTNASCSKEETQNKENAQHAEPTQPKVMSPNRSRVKMGTRAFSTYFLHKSYDNIYDVDRIDDIGDERFDSDSTLHSASIISGKFSESPLPSEAYVIREYFYIDKLYFEYIFLFLRSIKKNRF